MDANTDPYRVTVVGDAPFYANSHPFRVKIVGGEIESMFKTVSELPDEPDEEGKGKIFVVPNPDGSSDNKFIEWMWADQGDGTFAWEKVGEFTPSIETKLYSEYGTNTDGALTQAFISEKLNGNKVVIGEGASAEYGVGISIGAAAKSTDSDGAMAIGVGALASSNSTVALGRDSSATAAYATALGRGAGATAVRSTAVGYGASTYSTECVVVGSDSKIPRNTRGNVVLGHKAQILNTASYGVVLGAYSSTDRNSAVSVGDGSLNPNYGTRYIANVRDPELAQDAATKNYVDNVAASIFISAYTSTEFNNLWENA